jgi:hypothetical protein
MRIDNLDIKNLIRLLQGALQKIDSLKKIVDNLTSQCREKDSLIEKLTQQNKKLQKTIVQQESTNTKLTNLLNKKKYERIVVIIVYLHQVILIHPNVIKVYEVNQINQVEDKKVIKDIT